MAHGRPALIASYTALLDCLDSVDEPTGWRATGCEGWSVRDLLFHLTGDAQRALVALHTPAGTADTDEVAYWRHFPPDPTGTAANIRGVRVSASAWTSVGSIAELYSETVRAVLVAVGERDGDEVVGTQGMALTVDALLSTLAVEATIHHLDLRVGEPSAAGLTEVRRVLDGLLGHPSPLADDSRWAVLATGRAQPTPGEQEILGPDRARLPLLG